MVGQNLATVIPMHDHAAGAARPRRAHPSDVRREEATSVVTDLATRRPIFVGGDPKRQKRYVSRRMRQLLTSIL